MITGFVGILGGVYTDSQVALRYGPRHGRAADPDRSPRAAAAAADRGRDTAPSR